MRTFLLGIGLLAVLTLAGCGASTACTGTTFNGQCFGIVSAGTLVGTEASLTGTGSVVAQTPLTGPSSNNSFRLAFTLTDGGLLTLHANATATLGSGVQVEFKRVGSNLEVKLKGSGTSKDISSFFTAGIAAAAMTFQIDLHNSENPVHALIWDGAVTAFTLPNVLGETEDGTPASGTGAYWGLELSNATVTTATPSAQKFTE